MAMDLWTDVSVYIEINHCNLHLKWTNQVAVNVCPL